MKIIENFKVIALKDISYPHLKYILKQKYLCGTNKDWSTKKLLLSNSNYRFSNFRAEKEFLYADLLTNDETTKFKYDGTDFIPHCSNYFNEVYTIDLVKENSFIFKDLKLSINQSIVTNYTFTNDIYDVKSRNDYQRYFKLSNIKLNDRDRYICDLQINRDINGLTTLYGIRESTLVYPDIKHQCSIDLSADKDYLYITDTTLLFGCGIRDRFGNGYIDINKSYTLPPFEKVLLFNTKQLELLSHDNDDILDYIKSRLCSHVLTSSSGCALFEIGNLYYENGCLLADLNTIPNKYTLYLYHEMVTNNLKLEFDMSFDYVNTIICKNNLENNSSEISIAKLHNIYNDNTDNSKDFWYPYPGNYRNRNLTLKD